MLRALWAFIFAFAVLWAAQPCAAADLEAACAKFNSCYNDGDHDVCWKRHESQLLSKRDAKASRQGTSLHVLTLRGPVIFTDTLDEKKNFDGAWYRYLGFFPDIGQHLIGVPLYEGKNFLLVSHATGEFAATDEAPHLSPNGKLIAMADTDMVYGPDHIKIWALENGRLQLVHSEPFNADSAHFVRWEDDTSFTVELFKWEDGKMTSSGCQDKTKPFMFRLYTYRWELGVLTRSLAREPNARCSPNN